jgi:hypothetical protein
MDFNKMPSEELADYIPNTLEDVIKYLQYAYPWKLFPEDIKERKVWTRVGNQQVIEFLESKLKGLE